MIIRCIKCNSKLSTVKEIIKVNAKEPLVKIEIKCKKCSTKSCYFIPTCLNDLYKNK